METGDTLVQFGGYIQIYAKKVKEPNQTNLG